MWPFATKPPLRPATAPAAPEAATACPTAPCTVCRNPMPIVGFDQRCPRCRTLVPASPSCPGGCSGCEMGKG